MRDFQGRVGVVTGAGQGIGRGIATILAGRGARVVLTDINNDLVGSAADELRAGGHEVVALAHDVADTTSTTGIIREVVERFGRFDFLVNNAGVAAQTPFDQVTEAEWDRLHAINLRGLFFACQAAGIYFKERGGGRIVNISSFAGRKPVEEYVSYNTTKAGVVMVTQTLALELGPADVTVNAVCPGIVRTPIWDSVDPEQWSRQEKLIPLRRGQTIDDISEAVAFLLSDRARNITGATIPVTGGLAMW